MTTINDASVAASQALVAKFQVIATGIRDNSFKIDGSGDTFTMVTGLIVQTFGASLYEQIVGPTGACMDEKNKVLALIEGLIEHLDMNTRMAADTLSMMKSFGANEIKFV